MDRRLLAAVVVATSLAVAPAGAAGPAAAIERGITVSGTASVTVVPDRADFAFGVRKQGAGAAATLAAARTAAAALVAALEASGVAAEDIRTDQLALAPRFSKGRVVGYAAVSSVSVRIRDLGRIAAVLDAAVRAGATSVDGPSFSRSNAAELYRQTLARALDDARAKAQTIAAAAGSSVGPILEVREGASSGTDFGAVAAPVSAGGGVEPGSQEIDASVTVTFAAA
jgi:uncharacterized protein YggE